MAHIHGLFSRYEAALNHKESIINNREPYYYNVTIKTKHRNRWIGIVVHPSYSYHTERRFNQNGYDQALANASATIHQIGIEIEASLTSLRNSVQSVNSSDLAACQTKYKELQELNQNNSCLQLDIRNATTQSQSYNITTQSLQSKLQENNNSNYHLRQQSKVQSEENFNVLKTADLQQRAFFLSELWMNKDAKENKNAIELLQSLGFDANALAYYAIIKNNEELFDLALNYKATCSSYMIEGTTLLQKVIHNNNEKFIQKVLDKDMDINVTILNAIANDMPTINKLLEYNNELTKQKFFGYTLLQIAIDVKNHILVKKILDIDNLSTTILTDGGESALKIAVRSGNNDIIKTIASQVNLKTEVEQLGQEINNEIKAKILEERDIETVIKLFKGDTKLLTKYTTKQCSNEEMDLLEFTPKFNNDSSLDSGFQIQDSKCLYSSCAENVN